MFPIKFVAQHHHDNVVVFQWRVVVSKLHCDAENYADVKINAVLVNFFTLLITKCEHVTFVYSQFFVVIHATFDTFSAFLCCKSCEMFSSLKLCLYYFVITDTFEYFVHSSFVWLFFSVSLTTRAPRAALVINCTLCPLQYRLSNANTSTRVCVRAICPFTFIRGYFESAPTTRVCLPVFPV